MTQEVKIIGGITIISVLLLIIGVFIFSGQEKNVKNNENTDKVTLSNNNRHKKTTDSAKVTVVEFADFQCPACARTQPIINQLLEEYKGQANFVFRHFPLPQHKNAITAAVAAEAAAEEGKFFEMSDILYSRQVEWSEENNPKEIFIKYADEIGLDKDQFMQNIESSKYDKLILEDKSDGTRIGVNSTPTFYINGNKILEPTYDNLKEAIISQI